MAEDTSATDDDKREDAKSDDSLGEAGQKALARERQARREAEARIRELEPLAQRAKAAEDEKKTEIQRLSERIEKLTRRAEEADRRALIAEIAQEKKLTPAQARRLQGSTREELEQDADELLTAFGAKTDEKKDAKSSDDDGSEDTGKAGDRRRPKEKLRSGSVSDTGDDEDFDPEKVAESVYAHRF